MNKRGFTLIEIIIGLLAGAVVSLAATFMFMPIDNWVMTQSRRTGTSEVSAAVSRIMKEVGRIKAPNQITTMTATQLGFTDIDDAAVSFQQSGSDLLRNGDALVRNVQNLTFSYLDKDGVVTGTAEDVRTIMIELAITEGSETIRLLSGAMVMNL